MTKRSEKITFKNAPRHSTKLLEECEHRPEELTQLAHYMDMFRFPEMELEFECMNVLERANIVAACLRMTDFWRRCARRAHQEKKTTVVQQTVEPPCLPPPPIAPPTLKLPRRLRLVKK